MITMSWDSLHRLHKIVGNILSAASEIDELGPNFMDYGLISDLLKEKTGVSLRKFRDCCDELNNIHKNEYKRAKECEKKYMSPPTSTDQDM